MLFRSHHEQSVFGSGRKGRTGVPRWRATQVNSGSPGVEEEICALVTDFLAGLPADMKRFLDFEGLMGTSASEMGCEV